MKLQFVLEVSKKGLIKLSLPVQKKTVSLCTPDNDGLLVEEILGVLREGARLTVEVKSFKKEAS